MFMSINPAEILLYFPVNSLEQAAHHRSQVVPASARYHSLLWFLVPLLFWLNTSWPPPFTPTSPALSSIVLISFWPSTLFIVGNQIRVVMDPSNAKMLLQLVGKLPLIARVALLHMLHMSPPSKYIDLRSELTVAVIRSFIDAPKPMSITHTQKILNRDPGIKGRIWVAKYTSPAPPENSIRDVIISTVESMRTAAADGSRPAPLDDIQWPNAVSVEAEWTGYRKNATSSSTLPPILELEKYAELMREVTSPATVLYFHGGAYYLMDPASHRPTTKKIAKLTGGRCYSVRYRLAPQHPFPAALVDALQSYLTLLHPPKGAFHDPVKPENIVFAGDRYVPFPLEMRKYQKN